MIERALRRADRVGGPVGTDGEVERSHPPKREIAKGFSITVMGAFDHWPFFWGGADGANVGSHSILSISRADGIDRVVPGSRRHHAV